MSSCAHQTDSPTGVSNSDLFSKINNNDAPTIVDVRTEWEYQNGHLPNALHMPFLSTFFHHDEIPAPHDKPVVVYCEHGPRAWIARFALKRAGFEKVLYLNGHMSDWRKAGLPIEKPTEEH